MKVTDGVYRDWTVSRWARRLHMDRRITLRDGVLTVSSPGIYFIYAQINYLDNHEVNAYQILVNDSPWLMCTTMTHTPDPTTKVLCPSCNLVKEISNLQKKSFRDHRAIQTTVLVKKYLIKEIKISKFNI